MFAAITTLAAALGVVPLCFSQQAGSPPLPSITLDDAVSAVLSAGDDAASLKETLLSARGTYDAAAAKNGFTLTGNAGYSAAKSDGNTSISTSWSKKDGLYMTPSAGLSAGLPSAKISVTGSHAIPPSDIAKTSSVSYLLFSFTGTVWDGYLGGQAKAGVDKAELVYKGKELSYSSSRSALVIKAKQAYATMLGAQRALSLKIDTTKKQKLLLDQVSAIFAMRQASQVDLETAQVNASQAELDEETARHDLAMANRRLSLLMGRPAGDAFYLKETEDSVLPAPDADAAVAIGLAKRADLAQLRLNRRGSEIDAVLAKGASQPGIALSAGINWAHQWTNADPSELKTISAGVTVTLPVLDAGAARGAAAAAKGLVDSYDAQVHSLSASIETDIRDAFWTVELQQKRVSLAKRAADLADDKAALTAAQQKFGTATLQDVMTDALTAATAEAAYLAARTAYSLNVAALETAMGL